MRTAIDILDELAVTPMPSRQVKVITRAMLDARADLLEKLLLLEPATRHRSTTMLHEIQQMQKTNEEAIRLAQKM